jgi:fucose 4-O-acetylase-like acetyltransferase
MTTGTVLPQVAPSAASASDSTRAARLVYLDNIRVALITLVVVGHIAIMYGAPGAWFYYEVETTTPIVGVLFTFLLGIGASFLLGLFFYMAAYLTPPAYERKGARRFVADRLLRLGVPLLIFAFVINPLIECGVTRHDDPSISWLSCLPTEMPGMDGGGFSVMWFVELLLIFSLLYVALRAVRPGPLRTETRAPGNAAIALFALALGLVTFLVRLVAPVNWWWEPPHLEPAHLPQYVFFFAAGIMAYQGGWFERLFLERVRVWRWVALAGVLTMPLLAIAAGALEGELRPDGAGGWNALALAYSVWEGFTGVAMTITVLAWARASFNRQGPLLREMARCSYAVYFLHPPIIVFLALALSGIAMSGGLKFLWVAPLGVALCYLVAYALRRVPGVRRIL